MSPTTAIAAIRLAALTGLLLAFMGTACGIKGPPVPKGQPPPPMVTDLACQVAEGSATLTWHLPVPLAAKTARQAAFGIFRSRSDLAQPACENCPLVFEKVGTEPYLDKGNDPFSFDVSVESGYRYVFMVRLEIKGVAGPDSNTVRFDLN